MWFFQAHTCSMTVKVKDSLVALLLSLHLYTSFRSSHLLSVYWLCYLMAPV